MRFGVAIAVMLAMTGTATAQATNRAVVATPTVKTAPTPQQQKTALEAEIAALDKQIAALKRQQASNGKPDESLAMKLQEATNKRTKAMSTLSNVMKKMSDTSQSITQNIK